MKVPSIVYDGGGEVNPRAEKISWDKFSRELSIHLCLVAGQQSWQTWLIAEIFSMQSERMQRILSDDKPDATHVKEFFAMLTPEQAVKMDLVLETREISGMKVTAWDLWLEMHEKFKFPGIDRIMFDDYEHGMGDPDSKNHTDCFLGFKECLRGKGKISDWKSYHREPEAFKNDAWWVWWDSALERWDGGTDG